MKYLVISDIHGRDDWKNWVYQIDEDAGMQFCNIRKTFDKVIFLGDYVDSYNKKNYEILNNLLDIINLKNEYPDNVILLIGNHDAAYMYDEPCSGYRGDMHFDLKEIFNRNRNLFQIAYQDKNVIFTHAGIHRGWWKYYALPIIEGIRKKRYTPYFITCNNIADQLNLMFEFNDPILRMVGIDRGGWDRIGGPLWVDKSTLYNKSIPGFHQVVGHSVLKNGVKSYDFGKNTKITFTDCENREPYYIEI